MINKCICLMMIIFALCPIAHCTGPGFKPSAYFVDVSDHLLSVTDNEEGHTNTGGSNRNTYLSEESPIKVSRTIVKPLRDEYFHNDTIVVEVKVTSIRTKGAKNLRIWEVPSEGLLILNCSYPIVSASMEVINDYENSDKSSLNKKDLNTEQILKLLIEKNNSSEIKRIKELFSKNTTSKIANTDINNDSQLSNISADILSEFNKIINNATNLDFNSSHLSNNPRNFDRINEIDYYINADEYLDHIEKQDYRLLKRKLLEYAFSNETADGIRKLSFNKKHENQINESANPIYIEIPSLCEHESLVFKYYLKAIDIGKSEIKSEIHAEDFHHEEKISLEIIERRPRFAITFLCPSKELITTQSTEFEYTAEYLGGDENVISSSLSINPVKNGPTDESYCTVEPSCFNNITFVKGKIKKFNANVTYSHIGSRLSPPTITVNGEETKFEPDISVYPELNWTAKNYYELASIIVILIAFFELIYIYIERKKQQDLLDNYNNSVTLFTKIASEFKNERRKNSRGESSYCQIDYQDEDCVPRFSYDS